MLLLSLNDIAVVVVAVVFLILALCLAVELALIVLVMQLTCYFTTAVIHIFFTPKS